MTRLIYILLLFLFAGCAVGPDYVPHEIEGMPETWNAAPGTEGDVPAELSRWWLNLDDPVLSGLIERAVKNNNDIKTAALRVRRSRANLGISRAGLLPSADASASARESRSTDGDTTTDRRSYSLGIDASWEIDIFGGTRRAVEAAKADLSTQEEALRDVRVSLSAEVALTYVEVRSYQHRIDVTEKGLSLLNEEVGLAMVRRESGLMSGLDLAQIEENVASTEAELPRMRDGLNRTLNSMAILLGMPPGSVHEQLSAQSPLPGPPENIDAGIPAELLRRRPDIRRAERALAAETARIGVAKAELYPRLSLSGSFAYEGSDTETGGISTSSTGRSYSFGPSLRVPVFRAGAIRRNIEVQSLKQEEAVVAYEQAVINAIAEVENALLSLMESEKELELLNQALASAVEIERLKDILHTNGLEDFEGLLSARKTVLSLKNRIITSEAGRVSELIRLYKALGGGWNYMEENMKDTASINKVTRSEEDGD